jgi:hypothetical protein
VHDQEVAMNRKLVVALAAVFALAMTMGSDVAWS